MITLVNNVEVSANEVILTNLLWCDHFEFVGMSSKWESSATENQRRWK